MILKPQDLLVAFKLVAWGAQRWTYARLAQELGISTSEAHACIKRGLISGLLLRQEPPEPASRRGARAEASVSNKTGVIERRVGRSRKEAVDQAAGFDNPARVGHRALAEFAIHGAKYAFVAELLPVCIGVPTALADPVFAPADGAGESHVWPHAQGTARGTGVKPLHPNVPFAAMQDARLYELLANFDLLRVGRTKERAAAAKRLQALIGTGDAPGVVVDPAPPTGSAEPAPVPTPEPTPEPASIAPAVAAQEADSAPQMPTPKARKVARTKDKPDDQFSFSFES